MRTMKAAVFVEPGRILLEEKPVPEIGLDDALVRITTTTICGTDVHILRGEIRSNAAGSSATSRSA
jgi:alcohol dehydrogenase